MHIIGGFKIYASEYNEAEGNFVCGAQIYTEKNLTAASLSSNSIPDMLDKPWETLSVILMCFAK